MKYIRLKVGYKIIILGLIASATALFITMWHYDTQFTDYGRNAEYLTNFGYARAFKVNRLDYESILKKYGVPIKEETQAIPDSTDRHVVLMQYPSFDMSCVEYEKTDGTVGRNLFLLIIQNDTIRFGRDEIRIGSTQEEVHRAYSKELKISVEELVYSAENYPNVDEGFYGEDWSRILFCYDDNGFVESMAYEPPAF